ncbi:MAG: MFS transporter [Clostridia bacterium]|nr:MFS transporter [Clostridia bacterium]
MNSELTRLKRMLILLNVSLSTFMATLDGSIVNNALPTIAGRLKVPITLIQWVVTAYLLSIAVLLPVWGKLSDLYGKKKIFMFGFFGFTIGSALCGFSHTLLLLVLARVLQAVGASAMMGLGQGIITAIFPPEQRGRALGITGTMVALGSLTGPSLGGILVSTVGWPSIFFINVPIGVVGVVLTFFIMPEISERQADRRFDFGGTALFSAAVLLLFIGLLLLQAGLLPMLVFVVMLVLSAVCVAAFIAVEGRTQNPLIRLQLFKIHEFSFGLASAYLAFIASNATLYFLPFYLQDILGLSPLQAGLLISFFPISTLVVAPISGWLSDKISYRPLTIAGMGLSTVVLLLFTTLNRSSPHAVIALFTALYGIGTALFQSPNNSSVMGSVPKHQLGIAGSINALFRNLGMVSGTAFSVLLFSFVTHLGINALSQGTGTMEVPIFLRGLHGVFIMCAVCTFLAALLSLTRAVVIRPVKSESAQ